MTTVDGEKFWRHAAGVAKHAAEYHTTVDGAHPLESIAVGMMTHFGHNGLQQVGSAIEGNGTGHPLVVFGRRAAGAVTVALLATAVDHLKQGVAPRVREAGKHIDKRVQQLGSRTGQQG